MIGGPLKRLLSGGYGLAVRLHQPGVSAVRAPIPVISVGNLEVGGTGKSPFVQALCAGLRARGRCPAILSRGYGGRLSGPLRVDPGIHTARQVGDEPLMHASAGYTCFISGNRAASAALAAGAGFDLAVLDDGHATKSLARDFAVVLFRPGFAARPELLPLGRLREPLARGIARADLVVVGGAATDDDLALVARLGKPVLLGDFITAGPPDAAQAARRHVLVTGVANPQRVTDAARDAGWHIAQHLAYRDHHRFSNHDAAAIMRACGRAGALLTTAKDVVRLPPVLAGQASVLAGGWRAKEQNAFDAVLDHLADIQRR